MNNMDASARLKIAATYNAAADHFDAPPLGFWGRHGAAAAQLAALKPGDRVLDAGCGTGASALPAAAAVGPGGHVMGIDIAESMLAHARSKALAQGLRNIDFKLTDMARLGTGHGAFDAVISVFSVFFVEDVAGQLARLWRLVRPGGRLVVTVWAEGALEPGQTVFFDELAQLRPELCGRPRPWQRLTEMTTLRATFAEAGIADASFHPAPDVQTLSAPDDFWTIAMGSGYRGEIDQLEPDSRAMLRTRLAARISAGHVSEIDTGAIHALAIKPTP
jgi:ubiquinone/menaquinone biosynthesis C-methylase UbiE